MSKVISQNAITNLILFYISFILKVYANRQRRKQYIWKIIIFKQHFIKIIISQENVLIINIHNLCYFLHCLKLI